MKRFALLFAAAMALINVASAEAIFFDIGAGGVTFGGGVGNSLTFILPVTTVHAGTAGSCSSCTIKFTTGPMSSFTNFGGLTGDNFGGSGSYSVTGSGISGYPGVTSPFATGPTGGSTVVKFGAVNSFSGSVVEPGSTGFATVVSAFGLPTAYPYTGSISLFFSSLTFTGTSGAFTGHVSTGSLELDSAPETTPLLMLGAGLFCLGVLRWRRQRVAD